MAWITRKFFIYLFGFWFFPNVDTVKITSLDVPKQAWDAVNLNCRYDLADGESLYGVKWYKDNTEFFRCMADGTVQEFQTPHVKIFHTKRSHLGSCFFELTAMTVKTGGEYTCEVSLDGPTFQTVTKSAWLQIIEPSKSKQPEPSESTTEMENYTMTNEECRAVIYLDPEVKKKKSVSRLNINTQIPTNDILYYNDSSGYE